MRLVSLVLLTGFTTFSIAQMPEGMQEAMDCMGSIDQDSLAALSTEGEQVFNKVKALCEKGEESEARKVAMGYVKIMKDNGSIEEMKRCSELMRKAMPSMDLPEIPSAAMYEEKSENICDNID